MAQSGRLRLGDVRQVYRLTHECRDLGRDPAAWTRHAVEQLTHLTGSQVGAAAELRPAEADGLPCATVLYDHGWSTPRHRAFWYRHYFGDRQYVRMPTFQRFAALPGPLHTRTREQLVDDAAWYRSSEFQDMHRAMGLDDIMPSCRLTREPLRLFAFVLFRPLRERRHRERERQLVHLFHHELQRYVGTALALERGGVDAGLPPRLRETLECLLEGDGEKQAAARLGLSRHTVHEYVTALYRRLGVSSRAELMALCLKRRP
jgi:DNA-binding CsgD family transcriptional regulator